MPHLQDFLGNRDYPPKPPATAGRSATHPNSKNERMRAIIKGLALSTDSQAKTKTPCGSQDSSVSGIRLSSNENDTPLPVLGAHTVTPRSSNTNTRWNTNKPTVGAPSHTQDLSWNDENLTEGTDPGHDIFGTDIENFDGTMASSDVTSSNFRGIHSRFDGGDLEKGFLINPNQYLESGHIQQGSMLLEREYHGHLKNETVVSSNKDIFMRSKAGKDGESQIGEPADEQRLDDLDMAGIPSPEGLEPDLDIGGQSRRRGTEQLHNADLRGRFTPLIAIAQNTASIGNPIGSARSVINPSSRDLPDIILAPIGDLDVKPMRSDELRKAGFNVGIVNRHSEMRKSSNLAEANCRNTSAALLGTQLSCRNNGRLDVKSSLDEAESSKEVPLRFCRRGPSFASGLEHSKGTVNLDHSIIRLEEMTYQQSRKEPCEYQPAIGVTGSPQIGFDLELSRKLRSLYDLRGNTDAHIQREIFFSTLNIVQSERCGDFIIEKFADILARYNAVRRRRRDIATELEIGVARRERCVRIRKEVVDQNLEGLRQAGKVAVRGKNLNTGL